jgi:diguanylate cyclase (GGDEF)-like protein
MTQPTIHPAPLPGAHRRTSARTLAKRSRIATGALVLILLTISGFGIWSADATSVAADQAIAANALSDDYAMAATAVGAEESLERKYRLEPGPNIRARYDDSVASLATALGAVRRDGGASDRALVDRVLGEQKDYLAATDQLFAAVDRGDLSTVLAIDGGEVDPSATAVQTLVLDAAAHERQIALAALAHLQHLEGITRLLTPLVFLTGLGLAAMLSSILRGHRRLLELERARAVHDSLHDALTGLANRTLLADRFTRALHADARAGLHTGLLLIDLDRFKEINDTFGHHHGDELLTLVGARLAALVGDAGLVARLGGDEFAILLPGVAAVTDATATAATLRTALEQPFHVDGVDLDVEASVGVVLSGEHGHDAATLFQRADVAMYVAKAQNLGVFAYDPGVDLNCPTKVALLGDLRRALDRGELVLHYQPKVSIRTGDVVGAEALIRWQHPERGLIMPDDFIPLAEHTGLIGPLTRYVLDAALAQVRAWSDAGRPLTVSVNLSARNLLDKALPGQVAALLATHGVGPALLELEVTETAIMTEPVRAQHVLEELSALGIRISIDDFGAGYTSLSLLKRLPVSELKIDRSFVTTMTQDAGNALIVHSVIDLGHNLGLTLVAEGVETSQALTALAGFGCDVAQGYHLSRPVTAAALDRWRADRHARPDLGRARPYGPVAGPYVRAAPTS